jgi:hypothetical protein
MDEQKEVTAERLAAAAEALDGALTRLESRFASLEQKVDRIVAMVEERASVAAQSETAERRKTVSAGTGALLSKLGAGETTLALTSADEMLRALSVEQRIAVKAELARAGLLQ